MLWKRGRQPPDAQTATQEVLAHRDDLLALAGKKI
jgi:hypothetical protein